MLRISLWSRSFLTSFLLALLVLVLWNHRAAKSLTPVGAGSAISHDVKSRLRQGLSKEWLVEGFDSPVALKSQHVFWLTLDHTFPKYGLGVPVLRNPILFGEMFPGYDFRLTQDKSFWRRYFRRPFDMTIRAPSLNPTGREYRDIDASSTGCLDFFEHEGADVVLLGTSGVYLAIIPKKLHDQLAEAFKDPRILMCARPGFGTGVVDLNYRSTRILAQLGHRAKAVIWGYDLWPTYSGNAGPADPDSVLTKAIDSWQHSSLSLPLDFRISAFFDQLSWGDLFPYNRRAIEAASNPLLNEGGEPEKVSAILKQIGANGFAVSDKKRIELPTSPADEPLLRKAMKELSDEKPKDTNSELMGATERDCDMKAAAVEFDRVIDQILKFADDVYVYMTPTTEVFVQGVPKCYRDSLNKMLLSRVSDRVHVKTEDSPAFGLTLTDHLRLEYVGSRLFYWLDTYHVNYLGAEKVTRRIAEWVVTETKRKRL